MYSIAQLILYMYSIAQLILYMSMYSIAQVNTTYNILYIELIMLT